MSKDFWMVSHKRQSYQNPVDWRARVGLWLWQ